MPLSSGQRVGPYEILAPIGAGGMGEVYKARDTKLDREVAIKVLPAMFSEDAERLARFEREAKVLASLNHPNIASIYGLEERALVMEFVEGESPKGPISFDEGWKIASQIAEALDYAHERGIVHRDLKPANVKITPDGVVKLLDFGLAKAFSGPAAVLGSPENSPTLTLGATQVGLILGTAAYMAPEQAKGKSVDKRADIWAFGVVLYELLTGERLFDGSDVADTLAQVLTKQPDLDKTPVPVRRLLRRCLERDPKERLRDIGEARFLLDVTRAHSGSSAPAQSWISRAGPLGWLVAAALAFLTAIALWGPFRQEPADAREQRFHIEVPGKQNPGLFALSPDGRRLAFWAIGFDGIMRLWVRPMDSVEARPLSGTELGNMVAVPPPFWSPDGRFLAFYADNKLKKVDVMGGPPQTISDVRAAIGGSWNAEGVILFGTGGSIMRVTAAGGAPTEVTHLDPGRRELRHVLPMYLPDNRHFLYLRVSSVAENSGIYIGSLDEAPAKQSSKLLVATTFGPAYLPSSKSHPGYLLYLREGTLMAQAFNERRRELFGEASVVAEHVGSIINGGYFSASVNSMLAYRAGGETFRDSQLMLVDAQGKPLGKILESAPYGNPAISPDGTRAAVSKVGYQGGGRDIWLIDFARETGARFTFETNVANNPVWSPDGNAIAFTANREGVNDLFVKAANNARNEQLVLKSAQNKVPTSWSSDGRFLLYTVANPKTNNDIWVLPLDSGVPDQRKAYEFLATNFSERDGRFSPDGHWVAYVSDESGRDEVYVRGFSPAWDGGKWLISKNGGANPRWIANGRALRYSSPSGDLMHVDVAVGAALQPGSPRPLFRLPVGAGSWDMSQDGKRFLVPVLPEQDAVTPFTVVLNWQAGLKK